MKYRLLCALLICATPVIADRNDDLLNDLGDRYYDAVLDRIPHINYFVGIEVDDHNGMFDNSLGALETWNDREDAWYAELMSMDARSFAGKPEWVTYGALREQLEANIGLRACRSELWGVDQMSGWQLAYPRIAQAQPVGTKKARQDAILRWSQFANFIDTERANLQTGVEQGYTSPNSVTGLVIGQMNKLLDVDIDDSPFMSPAKRDEDENFARTIRRIVTNEINPSLQRYRDYLVNEYLDEARDAISVTANPDGLDCYKASLRSYTTLKRSPEAVYELGSKTVAANRQRVIELGKKLYKLDGFEEIILHVQDDPDNRFDTREEVLEFSRLMVERTEGLMPNWFGALPKRPVTVEPYPAYQDGTGVSSRYETPNGDEPGVYRINLFEPENQKRGGAEITAVHEAYPGHHLQIAIAMDLEGLHPVTRLVFNSGFVEGWARYSEALAEEMGLYESDTALITRRAWPARGMVVDPGIHVMGWSREQAIDFMNESGRFSPERGQQMVDRIAILPGQLTAYDSGALEMFALRDQAERELGDAFDIREFHDRLLENGTIPLWMLREHMESWIASKK